LGEREICTSGSTRGEPDAQVMLRLDPFELLDGLASLVSPPCSHGHRDWGVLTPKARLRPMVTARATAEPATTVRSRASSLWAAVLARLH
jgi:hypothetical protein